MASPTARRGPGGTPRTWFHRRPVERDDEALLARGLAGVAVVAAAPMALAVAVVTATVVRATRLRWWWALAPAAAGAALLAAAGPAAAWAAYTGVYREAAAALPGRGLWALLGERGPAWALASAPLALLGGGVAAAAWRLFAELRRPAWREHARRRRPNRRRLERRRARIFAGEADPLGGLALGLTGDGRVCMLSAEELRNHVFVCGATNSGKTVTVLQLLRPALRAGAGIVYVDLKGSADLAARLETAAAAAGRSFRRWTLDGPGRWNPLAQGNPTERKDKLVAALGPWTEEHYRRAGERHLQLVFRVLVDPGGRPGRSGPVTLAEVEELMHVDELAARARDLADEALAERVAAYAAGMTADRRSGVAGVHQRLALLLESSAAPWLAEAPGDPAIDLLEVVRSGDVVVFQLNASRYPETAAAVAGAVVQDLTGAAGRLLDSGATRTGAFVVVDEFSPLRGAHVLALVAQGREAGMRVILSTQELGDLAKVDPAFCDQVLANTSVKVVHRQMVPESAERLAAMAGTEQVWEETLQVTHADPLAVGEPTGGATGLGSLRRVDRFRVHPNTIKDLPQGRAVVLVKHPASRLEVVDVVMAGAAAAAPG